MPQHGASTGWVVSRRMPQLGTSTSHEGLLQSTAAGGWVTGPNYRASPQELNVVMNMKSVESSSSLGVNKRGGDTSLKTHHGFLARHSEPQWKQAGPILRLDEEDALARH